MTGISVHHDLDSSITVRSAGVDLLTYVYAPAAPRLESPKPYLHPLRTRSGAPVSLYRPHDHVWHKGISWSLPHVGDENYWGGPTYIHGSFYVQLPNNGTQQHERFVDLERREDSAFLTHELAWISQSGKLQWTERRTITAALLPSGAWMMGFDTTMTNVSGKAISIGSPTTKGRDNAGYGGLFWRGPRSFTGGRLVADSDSGGDELRGSRQEWMAFEGRHDCAGGTALVLMVDHPQNPQHPPQWFARSEEFACMNPAPFFSEELLVEAGDPIRFRYGVGFADAAAGQAPALAAEVRALLSSSPTPATQDAS